MAMQLDVLLLVRGSATPLTDAVDAAVERASDRNDTLVRFHDLARLHIADGDALHGEDDGEGVLRGLARTDAVLVVAAGATPAVLERLLVRGALAGRPVGLVLDAAGDPRTEPALTKLLGAHELRLVQPVITLRGPGGGAALDALLDALDTAVHD
jgi:flavin-binding protein dodecin